MFKQNRKNEFFTHLIGGQLVRRKNLKRCFLLPSTLFSNESDLDHCLKYYRAPRYNVRCVMIAIVEQSALVAQINDLHLLKQRIFAKALTKVTNPY